MDPFEILDSVTSEVYILNEFDLLDMEKLFPEWWTKRKQTQQNIKDTIEKYNDSQKWYNRIWNAIKTFCKWLKETVHKACIWILNLFRKDAEYIKKHKKDLIKNASNLGKMEVEVPSAETPLVSLPTIDEKHHKVLIGGFMLFNVNYEPDVWYDLIKTNTPIHSYGSQRKTIKLKDYIYKSYVSGFKSIPSSVGIVGVIDQFESIDSKLKDFKENCQGVINKMDKYYRQYENNKELMKHFPDFSQRVSAYIKYANFMVKQRIQNMKEEHFLLRNILIKAIAITKSGKTLEESYVLDQQLFNLTYDLLIENCTVYEHVLGLDPVVSSIKI